MCVGGEELVLEAGELGPLWGPGPRAGGHVIIFSLGKTAIRL